MHYVSLKYQEKNIKKCALVALFVVIGFNCLAEGFDILGRWELILLYDTSHREESGETVSLGTNLHLSDISEIQDVWPGRGNYTFLEKGYRFTDPYGDTFLWEKMSTEQNNKNEYSLITWNLIGNMRFLQQKS
jgi:hypothetical protein